MTRGGGGRGGRRRAGRVRGGRAADGRGDRAGDRHSATRCYGKGLQQRIPFRMLFRSV